MAFDFKETKTEYKHVRKITHGNGKITYLARYIVLKLGHQNRTSKTFDCIKEAARSVDMYLIKQGKDPVNILVKK